MQQCDTSQVMMGQEEHVRVSSVKMHAEDTGEGRTVVVFCWFKWGAANDYIQSPDTCTTSQYMQGYESTTAMTTIHTFQSAIKPQPIRLITVYIWLLLSTITI